MTIDIKTMISELAVPEVPCPDCLGNGWYLQEVTYKKSPKRRKCKSCKNTDPIPQFPWARTEFGYGMRDSYNRSWRPATLKEIDLDAVLVLNQISVKPCMTTGIPWGASICVNPPHEWSLGDGDTPKEAAIVAVYKMWTKNEN